MNTNIAELAERIAQHLDGWEPAESRSEYTQDNGWLAHESGAEIHLRRIWNHEKRIRITGTYPRRAHYYPLYGVELPKITCAISRGPEAIAKGIRRFLPDYMPLYHEAKQAVKEYEAEEFRKQQLIKELGQAIGIEADTDYQGHPRVHGDAGPVWVTIEPYGSDSVKVELARVPKDIALKVCEVLSVLH